MKKKALKFEDFQDEKLSKKQQKTVRGGEGDIDPGKGSGGSGNNDEEETQRIVIQPVIKPNT